MSIETLYKDFLQMTNITSIKYRIQNCLYGRIPAI